jgi:small subunit ribosomal protein S9
LAVDLVLGTGRRKTSIARVILRKGKGEITINGRKIEEYFPLENLRNLVIQPLAVTDNTDNLNIIIKVKGGGITGQSDACKHGIARALLVLDPDNRPVLRANGLLMRDSRMVERKKYGQRGARRKFQFSKR